MSLDLSRICTASLDLAEMRRRFGHDDVLIGEVACAFLDALPQLRAAITRARDGADPVALQKAIHGMRGTLLDVTAFRAAELAALIEKDPDSARDRLDYLFVLIDEAAADAKELVTTL